MLLSIEHLDDPRVALYTRTGDGPYLRSQGLFVAEGRTVVRRLLCSQRFVVHSIFATTTAHRSLVQDLPGTIDVYVAEPQVLNAITGFNFHRGCLAIGRRPDPIAIGTFTNARRLLALEGIGNPDNVGGIFRVASAFGVEGVIIDHATADPLYRKAIRTGMGAVFHVPFIQVGSLVHAMTELRRRGFSIVALTPRSDATALSNYSAQPSDRLVIALGSEGAGLSDEALAHADFRVRIPIREEVDSLNVTVAAGIALAALA